MDILQQLQLVLDTSPHPLILADRNGTIISTNEKLDRLFGYLPNELIDNKVEILIPNDMRKHHPELRDAFFEFPQSRSMGSGRDLYGLHKNGNKIPVEIGLNPIRTDNETYVLATVLDITERTRLEHRFRLAVEAAPNAMIMVDSFGKIVMANIRAHEVFGYKSNELLGLSIENLMPERIRTKHKVFRTSFGNHPEPRLMGAGRELYGLRKDGSEFPVEIGLTPIDTTDGLFIMSAIVDITQRRKIEADIRAKNQKLSELNNELMQFAYQTSHDLKAPLMTIQGLSRIILEDLEAEDYEEIGMNAAKMISLTKKLSILVQDILNLTRADHVNEQKQEVIFEEIVDDIREKFAYLLGEYEVDLTLEKEHIAPLLSQPLRIRQVLENLISNGIKYSDPAKKDRFVKVRTSNTDNNFIIRVIDNGHGIPAQFHDQVFNMFKQFHNSKSEGSGLGLYLINKHIKQLGGNIDFKSNENGTEFVVNLSLKE